MKSKVERHKIIREVVGSGRISSQEELASILEGKGVVVAQATLSRDMRELKISKHHDEAGYYYGLSQAVPSGRRAAIVPDSNESITSMEFSGPVAILKTLPGHAGMVASIIDSGPVKEAAGTIAGDDTILLVIREGYSRDDLARSLGGIFQGLEDKRLN